MSGFLVWILGVGVAGFLLDRLLLFFEGRGWIYYRRSKAGRGASTYHLLEWTSTLDPSQRQVIEIRNEERREEDESGDPLGVREPAELTRHGEEPPGEVVPAEPSTPGGQ